MKKRQVTLLDRARADLGTAKVMLEQLESDEVYIDIVAHHCQQCAEKAVKYLILLQGDMYANDHRSEEYLAELRHEKAKELVEQIAHRIDAWATAIRCGKTILASRNAVEEVIPVCEELLEVAKQAAPGEVNISPENGTRKLVVGKV